MIDTWMGDDFFHNGAFRQSLGYDYVLGLESTKERHEVDYGKDASGLPRDGFDYFLERGSFAEDIKRSGSPMLPTWKAFLDHTVYDNFWHRAAWNGTCDKVTVPTLSVGGYYDQEDMYGPQEEYSQLEKHDSTHENFLVLGPWRHGSWVQRHGTWALCNMAGRSAASIVRRSRQSSFAKYLKDRRDSISKTRPASRRDRIPGSATRTFLQAEAEGHGLRPLRRRCHCGGHSLQAGKDELRLRPCQPGSLSPSAHPANVRRWLTVGAVDGGRSALCTDPQLARKDLASGRCRSTMTSPITGEVMADLFASTTGSDGDFVAKLIDVYPDDDPDPAMRGYQLMTNMEIFRGRYRKSLKSRKR